MLERFFGTKDFGEYAELSLGLHEALVGLGSDKYDYYLLPSYVAARSYCTNYIPEEEKKKLFSIMFPLIKSLEKYDYKDESAKLTRITRNLYESIDDLCSSDASVRLAVMQGFRDEVKSIVSEAMPQKPMTYKAACKTYAKSVIAKAHKEEHNELLRTILDKENGVD